MLAESSVCRGKFIVVLFSGIKRIFVQGMCRKTQGRINAFGHRGSTALSECNQHADSRISKAAPSFCRIMRQPEAHNLLSDRAGGRNEASFIEKRLRDSLRNRGEKKHVGSFFHTVFFKQKWNHSKINYSVFILTAFLVSTENHHFLEKITAF